MWQLYRCYGAGFDIDTENPINLVVRSVIFLLLIWYCDDIVNLALQIGGTPHLDSGQQPARRAVWRLQFRATHHHWRDCQRFCGFDCTDSRCDSGLELLKAAFEAAERYVVLGILVFTAPLAFAMGAARGTNNIFKSWCRMFSGQLLLLIMNAWCLKLFVNMVGEFLANPLSL